MIVLFWLACKIGFQFFRSQPTIVMANQKHFSTLIFLPRNEEPSTKTFQRYSCTHLLFHNAKLTSKSNETHRSTLLFTHPNPSTLPIT
jgi:hypothetical protein